MLNLHCGACMLTKKQLMSRLIQAGAADVPITNYGTAIAALNGILERVIEIFPELSKASASDGSDRPFAASQRSVL